MLPYHTRPACPAEYVPLLFSTFFSQKRAGQAKFFQNIFLTNIIFSIDYLYLHQQSLHQTYVLIAL